MKALNRNEWWLEYDSLAEYDAAMHAQTEQFWKNRGIVTYLDPKRMEELLKKDPNSL